MKLSIFSKQVFQTSSASFLLTLILIVCSVSSAAAAAGDLDVSFGSGGKVVTPFSSATDKFLAVAVQPDGKIVAAGFAQGTAADVTLARYNPNGTLDTTFNGTGKVVTDFGVSDDAAAIAIQPDGKIVIAGNSTLSTIVFLVARYNANGTLDTTFNGAGFASLRIGSSAYAESVAIQSDGKIVAAGTAYVNNELEFALVRYNPNGTLDTAFDGDGIVTTRVTGSTTSGASDTVYAVLLQPDGKIVAAGSAASSNGGYSIFGLARYNADGSLDTSFNGGKVLTQLGENESAAYSAAIQTDGKIVAAGRGYHGGVGGDYDFGLIRYNADGTLDTTFNGTGKVMTPIGNDNDTCNSVAIQTDGKIVAAGFDLFATTVVDVDVALVRYNTDGSLDTTFNGTGKVSTPVTDGYDYAQAVKIQPDGKIVAAGWSGVNGSNADSIVVRFLAASNVRASYDFDGDGKSDVSIFRPSNGSWYLLRSAAGFTGLPFGISSDKLVPADYDGDGKTDVAVVRNGNWYLQRSTAGFTGVLFGDGNDIPVPADYDGDGKAELAVFRPSNGYWYLLNLTTNQFTAIPFGISTDKPVPADYDGDGKTDIAVNRNGNWYLNRSSLGFTGILFGDGNDKLVPADYDGDGKADIAVFRPSNGTWYLLQSTAGFTGLAFGLGTDIPVAADYDGDGKADVAVVRNGNWYLNRTTQGFTGIPFGTATDKPIANAFVQ